MAHVCIKLAIRHAQLLEGCKDTNIASYMQLMQTIQRACMPLYRSGFVEEVGEGPGTGYNINVPWLKKGMGDGDYMVRNEVTAMIHFIQPRSCRDVHMGMAHSKHW